MAASRRFHLACLVLVAGTSAFAETGGTTPEEASRFLAQATLGASWEEIRHAADVGLAPWLEEQFERPVGHHRPHLDERSRLGLEVDSEHRRGSWWEQVMRGPDPLRQRIALALSEIFVVSDNLEQIGNTPHGLADYYDMLLDNAFGNYRDLLLGVTLHPVMGTYLSHLRNERSDPATGRFPDENFAREVMQLFSIGLYLLHDDGTPVRDGAGQPIPTYDIEDITEFAKVFTGLSFDSPDHDFHEGREVWTRPMRMYPQFHEPGPKRLLRGTYLPAGRTGMRDIEDAIDNLFEHPNAGPFIGRRLIQRLVTSNPSPAYLARVASAFADNGSGVRGDMRAVLQAILLDPEARDWPEGGNIGHGMLRESFLRRVHLARAFDAANPVQTYPIADREAPDAFSQRPLSSPSVFNFFLPDHQPTGPIAMAGLYAPEFQIITSVSAMTSANALRGQADGVMNDADDPLLEVRLRLTDEIAIAADVHALIDRLDLILMYGDMSAAMRQVLLQALGQLPDPEERARMAVFLIAISPEYCVLE